MNDAFMIALALLMIPIALATIRALIGPTTPDRVVGLDVVNTLIVSAMILFGLATKEVIYVDVAIIYALLSYVTTLFVAKYLQGGKL